MSCSCGCKNDCKNYEPRLKQEKEIIFTEFQRLVIDCKPEANKPVFVLVGRANGTTTALNYRCMIHSSVRSAYVCEMHPRALYEKHEYLQYVYPEEAMGYEEYIFDNRGDTEFALSLIKTKKVIICCTPHDFQNNIVNKLKGEFTVITGFGFGNIADEMYKALFLNLDPSLRDNFMGKWSYE